MPSISRAAPGATNLETAARILDVLWTPNSPTTTPADTSGRIRSGTAFTFWSAMAGAGSNPVDVYQNSPVALYTTPSRQTTIDAVQCTPRFTKYPGARPPSLELDPITRVLFRIARKPGVASAPAQEDFGVGFGMVATGNVGFFSVTQPGFGLVMDGAGGWRVWARQALAGAVTISQAILWPTTDADLTDWEWRITPATETSSALLQLLRQGQVVFSEFWSANRLSTYGSFPAGQRFKLVVGAGANAAVTDQLVLASLRYIETGQAPA